MRRQAIFSALLAVLMAVGVTGCSSDTKQATTTDKTSPIVEVKGDVGKAPTIEAGKGDPPKRLTQQVLHAGDGDIVTLTDTVKVHYTGQLWDGKKFDSSWDRGQEAQFQLQGVIQGWIAGLTGTRVGDRILLVIPPELAYGDQEQPNIPANSTLVFVVDVLDTTDASKVPESN